MAETCYTDEELDQVALSRTVMDDGTVIRVLPDDHPLIVERQARYREETQAWRDAARIDANHHFAGDQDQRDVIPYLNGEPRSDASECYVGERGWIRMFVRVDGDDVVYETLSGRVELRPKA